MLFNYLISKDNYQYGQRFEKYSDTGRINIRMEKRSKTKIFEFQEY